MLNAIDIRNCLKSNKAPEYPRFKKGQIVMVNRFLPQNGQGMVPCEDTVGEVILFHQNNKGYSVLLKNELVLSFEGNIRLKSSAEQKEYDKLLKEYKLYYAKENLKKAEEEYERILNS